jgi:hypothetical protein
VRRKNPITNVLWSSERGVMQASLIAMKIEPGSVDLAAVTITL